MVAPIIAAAVRQVVVQTAKQAAKKAGKEAVKTAAKEGAKKGAKEGFKKALSSDKGRNPETRQLSRDVDRLRHKYKYDVKKYTKLRDNATSDSEREKYQTYIDISQKGIETLRKGKDGYSNRALKMVRASDFDNEAANREARAQLKVVGKERDFYAAAQPFRQMHPELDTNEAIIRGMQDTGFEVKNLKDAMNVLEEESKKQEAREGGRALDFSKPKEGDENYWDEYDEYNVALAHKAIFYAIEQKTMKYID